MANANLNIVTITNTFDEWRTRTNALITDRNILRNHPYVKDNSNFVLANGAMVIARSGGGVLLTVIGADGDALIGGETTTTDLTVGIDASIGNSLVVGTSTANGNTIIYGNTSISKNTVMLQNANVTWGVSVGKTLEVSGNTYLYSNAAVSKNLTVSQNASVTGDVFVNTNKFIVYASNGDTVTFGDATISGGDIIANTLSLNLVNTHVETLHFAEIATDITVGSPAGSVNVRGDLLVSGGDITSTATANLLNSVSTTVNFAGAATTVEIGAATGTTNINNNLDVDGDVNIDGGDITTSTTTMNVFNATATTVNFAGAATTLEIGAATGTTDINNDLNITGDLDVDGGDITSTATANLLNTSTTLISFGGAAALVRVGSASGTVNVRNDLVVSNDLDVVGGDITGPASFNVGNTSATLLSLGGAATLVRLGSAAGTVNVRNDLTVTNDLSILGGDISSTATANLLNSGTTTLNFGGAATVLNMGAAAGTVTIAGDLQVSGNDIKSSTGANALTLSGSDVTVGGDLTVTGNDIKSSTGANALTLSGADVTVGGDLTVTGNDIRSSTGAAALSLSAADVTVGGDLTVTGNDIKSSTGANALTLSGSDVTVGGDLTVTGNDIKSSTGANALTLSGSDVTVGGDLTVTGNDIKSSTGANALTLSGTDVTVAGDLTISGGDIISTATANLLNTSATLINFGGAAANVVLGSPTGTVNIRNQLYTTDNVYIPQGKNLFAYFIQTSATESFYIERGNGVFKNVSVSGTFTLSQPSITTSDRIILNEVPSAARDGYITVRRGSATSNASLQWLETSGVWRAGGSDATLATILTTANVSDSFVSSSLVNVASANSVRWALANGTFGGTLKSYKDFVTEDTNVTGSKTIDMSVSNWYKLTLTGSSGNRAFTFTNAPASGTGITITLVIIQDGTGNKTPTWANTIYWAGGQVPPATTTASARDLWTFTTYDAGATFIGTLAVKDAK